MKFNVLNTILYSIYDKHIYLNPSTGPVEQQAQQDCTGVAFTNFEAHKRATLFLAY